MQNLSSKIGREWIIVGAVFGVLVLVAIAQQALMSYQITRELNHVEHERTKNQKLRDKICVDLTEAESMGLLDECHKAQDFLENKAIDVAVERVLLNYGLGGWIYYGLWKMGALGLTIVVLLCIGLGIRFASSRHTAITSRLLPIQKKRE